MLIILSGGGTGGSVAPLLAIAQEISATSPLRGVRGSAREQSETSGKKQYANSALQTRTSECEFLFIGTKKGIPEKELVAMASIPYQAIFSGKLRRYFDWQNFLAPIFILLGFLQSIFVVKKNKPAAIISCGGFVAVPLIWAGWLFKVPIFIHQQDIIPGLANKLMAPFAKKITVSFEKNLNDYPADKTILTGNPFRAEILNGNKKGAAQKFQLEENLPTLLVLGGGTGAQKINELIFALAPKLTKFCQIIHLIGRGRRLTINNQQSTISRYHPYEFLAQEMPDVFAAADLVISRAGMGVLTELSVLGKPAVIIPMPDSHQEINAQYFADKKAVILLNEKQITPDNLLEQIRELIFSVDKRSVLSLNISKLSAPDAAQKIAKIILENI